ncbi:hypothetical protein [Tropicimonas sp. IMCC6043]|uniref:hypothetical protein n=1 Tax=Tropicimonas sp. IMCC6043 TaxID=2510645 RepID=UPI00101CB9D6|nr:hypothetical protein [Tropicimonas sp. IMCC6043]
MALREGGIAFVEEGHSHRATAAQFRVSVKFVNGMVILKRETGGLEPRDQARRLERRLYANDLLRDVSAH